MSEDQTRIAHAFEDEVFFRLRSQRNTAVWISVLSIILASLCVIALVTILPLKEIQPFVVLVDKTTGEAERIVQVRPTTLNERDLIRQSYLVSYVTDRETYDPADNEKRIFDVLAQSRGQAEESLRALWNSGNPEFPPAVHGAGVRLTVRILNVSLLSENSAQVRFRKTREQSGIAPVSRDFVATVGFEFDPRRERNLETAWRNPLAFYANSWRVDAETLNNRS